MGLISRFKYVFFVILRVKKYQFLSNRKRVVGKPILHHPLLTVGNGKIIFGKNVQIGVHSAPNYYSHYTFMEVSNLESQIVIGENVAISNAFSIECSLEVIIDKDVLIGHNCSLIDNDGHDLHIDKRRSGVVKSAPIHICENVFLGSNVTILKGVTIGENSIIGNGSVVTKNIPKNVVACGNPAKVIREL